MKFHSFFALLVCFFGGLNASSMAATAVSNQYAPSLGAGVNFSETRTFGNCVQFKELETEALSMMRNYQESRINDRKELNTKLGIDASVSARAYWGSVNASVAHFKSVKFTEDSFYWLVDAKYETTLEKIRLSGPEFDLTPRAKQVLQQRGFRGFNAMCGTHFYSGRKLGARYTLLYQFNSKDDQVVNELKLKAGTNIRGIADPKGEFSRLVSQAAKASLLNVHSHILGGDNQLDDYARNPERLDAELKMLRDKLYEKKKGVVIEWYMSAYDQFPEIQTAKASEKFDAVGDEFRNNALVTYYNLHTANSTRLEKLRHIVEKSEMEGPMYLFADQDLEKIKDIIDSLQKQSEEVEILAQGCLSGTNECPTEKTRPLSYKVPKPKKDLRGLGQWAVAASPEKGSTKGIQFVKLLGDPGSPYKMRLFETNHRLYSTSAGAFAVVKNNAGANESIAIGSFTAVIDPTTGRKRPGICMGDYSTVCQLRAVENTERDMEDGYPVTHMQLTVFDSQGFIKDKLHFFVSQY